MRPSKGNKESRVLGPETSGKTILAPTSIAQALFNFEGTDIRTITGEDGGAWFVGKDVAALLGYTKTRNAISLHCKGALIQGVPTSSGVQQMTIIPERDLYRLIMRSKLSSAEAFEEWVVSEVLPAIRKTGSYRAPPVIPQTFAEAMQLGADQAKKAEQLALQNTQQAQKIHHLENLFQSGETIAAFGKILNGVNCSQINGFCSDELHWLYDENLSGSSKRWRVCSYARDKYLTETLRNIDVQGGRSFITHEPKLLQDGAKKLYQLYLDNRLPMKKTWDGEFSHYKFSEA